MKLIVMLRWILAHVWGARVPVAFFGYIRSQIDQSAAPGKRREIRYELEDPHFAPLLHKKVKEGIKQFGTLYLFVEAYKMELEEKRFEAEVKVAVYHARRRQLAWIERHYKKELRLARKKTA